MNVKMLLGAAAVLILFLAGAAVAQKIAPRPRFTSVYTSLQRPCVTINGKNGSDGASICRGPGTYQVRIYYSAAAMYVNAEKKGTKDSFNLATMDISRDETLPRLEWRMAGGKPFAVIIRVPKYGDSTPENPHFGKVIGHDLAIHGLKGFDSIDLTVDSQEPNANLKARTLADKAYLASVHE